MVWREAVQVGGRLGGLASLVDDAVAKGQNTNDSNNQVADAAVIERKREKKRM